MTNPEIYFNLFSNFFNILFLLFTPDWPSSTNLGVKQFSGSTQEGTAVFWSEILCTICNLFCELVFLNFIFGILGWNANSSLEGTQTPCQMFAELYQVSWSWYHDAPYHVLAWNMSLVLDRVTPTLETESTTMLVVFNFNSVDLCI